MCLKDVSLQLYTLQLKGRWGVCLAATPKDCHKPINTTPASTSPPTQMMSAFIRRVVIPPLVGCEAAAVLLFVSAPEKPERRRVSSGSPPYHHYPPTPTPQGAVSVPIKSCHVFFMHTHTSPTAGRHFFFVCKTPNAEMQHFPPSESSALCCSCYGYRIFLQGQRTSTPK